MELFNNVTNYFYDISSAGIIQEKILKSSPSFVPFLLDVEKQMNRTAERVSKVLKEKVAALNATTNYFEKLYADLMNFGEAINTCAPPEEIPNFFQSMFYHDTLVDPSSVSILSLHPLSNSSCVNIKLENVFNALVFTDSFPLYDIKDNLQQNISINDGKDLLITGTVSTTARETNVYPRASYHSYIDSTIFSYPRIHSFPTKNNPIDQEQKKFSKKYSQITSTDTSVPAGIAISKIHSAPYNFADVFFIIFLSDCDKLYSQSMASNPEILREKLFNFPAMFTSGQLNFSYDLLSEQDIYQYDDVDYPGMNIVADRLLVNWTVEQELLKTPLHIAVDIVQSIIEAKSDFSAAGIVFLGWNYFFPLKTVYKTFIGPSDLYLEFMNDMVRNVSMKEYCLMPTLIDLYEVLYKIYKERNHYLNITYRRRDPLYTSFHQHHQAKNNASYSYMEASQIRPMLVYILGAGLSTNNRNTGESTSILKLIKILVAKMKRINIQISIIAIPPNKVARAKLDPFDRRMLNFEQFCWLRRILLPHYFHTFNIDDYIDYIEKNFSMDNIWFLHRNVYFRHTVEKYLTPLRSTDRNVQFSAPYLNLHGDYMVSLCKNVFVNLDNLPKSQIYKFNYTPLINLSKMSNEFIAGSVCVELPFNALLSLNGLAHKSYTTFLVNKSNLSVMGSNSRSFSAWQYLRWSIIDWLPEEAVRVVLLRDKGLIELDLDTGYRTYYNEQVYNNTFNLHKQLPLSDSPYPLINRTRYLYFNEIYKDSEFVLLVSINRNLWDYPLVSLAKDPLSVPIEYLFCGTESRKSCIFYTPQVMFSKAFKNTGTYTYGLSQQSYTLPKLCESFEQMVDASVDMIENEYNNSLVGLLGLNPMVLRFARFALLNTKALQDCYDSFNSWILGAKNSVFQCIFIDLAGNTLAYPAYKCTNVYNRLIQDLLNQPVSQRISFHHAPCVCSIYFYDSDDPVILNNYNSYLYNSTCIAMAIRLYARPDSKVRSILVPENPEVAGFLIVVFTDGGLNRLYTKISASLNVTLQYYCPDYDPANPKYRINPLIYLDLHSANIYVDDFSSFLVDVEKNIDPHVIQMQYLLWYNGYLECNFRQYHDKVHRTMTVSKRLKDLFANVTSEKLNRAIFSVYSGHLGNTTDVLGVKNGAIMGFFRDVHGIMVDVTYMSLRFVPNVGCRRELEESNSLVSYYPQTNSLSVLYNTSAHFNEMRTEFNVPYMYSLFEQKFLFPILITIIFLLLFFTMFKAIFRRTPIKYRLQTFQVNERY